MKAIYKLNLDCGRNGNLTGVFIAEKEHVAVLLENKIEVYFGEVLGKHSEIFGALDKSNIEMASDDPRDVELVERLKLENGHDPFAYSCMQSQADEYGLEGYDNTVLDLIKHICSKKPEIE